MRRFVFLLAMILVPLLAVSPDFAGASGSFVAPAKVKKTNPPKKCAKPVKGAHKKPAGKACSKKKPVTHKPTPTPTRTPKKHKKPPTRATKPAATRTATPKPTSTSTPTSAPTATPTLTPTLTSTPTNTPTLTNTPVPPPSIAELSVRAWEQPGIRVAFYLCGVPDGVGVSFNPAPAIAEAAGGSPLGGAAMATLTVSTPYTMFAGTYLMPLHAFLEDSRGNRLSTSPGGTDLAPRAVALIVDQSGHSTLQGSNAEVSGGTQNCSSAPPGFAPVPTATPAPENIVVSASVSPQHPAANQVVTVSGNISTGGHGLSGVLMHTTWYMPNGILTCSSVSDATGTANCDVSNGTPRPNWQVAIDVRFTYNGQDYVTRTSYTM